MTKKIFRSILSVSLAVILCCSALITVVLYNYYENQFRNSLRNDTVYVSQGVELNGIEYLQGISKQGDSQRITLIDSNGNVLFDSLVDIGLMENHADREEFEEATENGWGESSRYSDTLSEKTFYYAQRLSDGSVLRLSGTQKSAFSIAFGMLRSIILVIVGAIILSLILSYWVSKATIKPINEIDLENPQNIEGYEELSPLLRKIAKQNIQIEKQMTQLKTSQQEFSVITENMTEGLIIIDSHTNILSYNKSALRIFNVKEIGQNESVYVLNRNRLFSVAVETALSGVHSEEQLKIGSRIYSILVNPVLAGENQVMGAVIVILDVTEKETREQLRKEFSANVSHELKTPLTSISGFAEIIKDGVAKPEDIPHFAENIYNEASRLITLIGDIIELSQLDESPVSIEKEYFDLSDVAKNVANVLKSKADKKNVTIELQDQKAIIFGSPRIVEETIYNLCDNAITYNVQGGKVIIKIYEEDNKCVVSVKDTGIGIASEYQERIFERFYRIDKSRSKETGGTGLGLSIVKHGAMLHNAKIILISELNKGTEIRIVFDKP